MGSGGSKQAAAIRVVPRSSGAGTEASLPLQPSGSLNRQAGASATPVSSDPGLSSSKSAALSSSSSIGATVNNHGFLKSQSSVKAQQNGITSASRQSSSGHQATPVGEVSNIGAPPPAPGAQPPMPTVFRANTSGSKDWREAASSALSSVGDDLDLEPDPPIRGGAGQRPPRAPLTQSSSAVVRSTDTKLSQQLQPRLSLPKNILPPITGLIQMRSSAPALPGLTGGSGKGKPVYRKPVRHDPLDGLVSIENSLVQTDSQEHPVHSLQQRSSVNSHNSDGSGGFGDLGTRGSGGGYELATRGSGGGELVTRGSGGGEWNAPKMLLRKSSGPQSLPPWPPGGGGGAPNGGGAVGAKQFESSMCDLVTLEDSRTW